ncbi:MAG: class I SAM-dependent methyltransferase [Opitutales bacterium]|nr:class I SAM-dependent methyltransferase [Opitutales bacterium]
MDNSIFDYSYHYSNWHSGSKISRNSDIRFAQKLFSDHAIFPKNKDSKVLEIGCGMGRFLLMLQEKGFRNLTGVDIDKTQIAIAQKEGLNVYLYDGIEWLKNTSDTFDVIYFFDVLEHIDKERQLEFLRLVCDHLNDGGMIALSVPNALAPSGMFYRYIDFTHTVSYSREAISFLLNNAGFHHIDIRPQHKECDDVINLKIPWAKIYIIEFGLKDIILTPNLVVVAFKDGKELKNYKRNAPAIVNDYRKAIKLKKRNLLSRIFKHLKIF